MNIDNLGQVFTRDNEIKMMLSLVKNTGSVLEPSSGNNGISKYFNNIISIELDNTVIDDNNTLNCDFFEYPIYHKFDTIIGNPPYVKYNNILPSTKVLLDHTIFDKRSNLFLFFIYKCIQHLNTNGELIFLTPRSFLNSTSSVKLNEFIYNKGTITDIIDFGDNVIFDNATPNVIIWRFEKDNFSRITNKSLNFYCNNGILYFLKNDISTYKLFSDIYYVKVGGVSGCDRIFTHNSGNIDVVCSYTCKTGKTKRMIYNIVNDHLLKNKDILLKRRIKRFNETNWYKWGRDFYISENKRIYVNNKTRNNKPFFTNESKYYDGSILGIFPYDNNDIEYHKDYLNSINWDELGFMCNNRYIFNQRSLSNTIISS